MNDSAGPRLASLVSVSVVVPCYRCAGTIERAVRSVAAQTRRPAELILVDDASPDDTAQTLEALRERYGKDWIQILRLPRNEGPAVARNAGWGSAIQPYIAFLDADDAWHPRKLEIQHEWMEAHPGVAVTGHESIQLRDGEDSPASSGGGEALLVTREALLASNRFITPSVMLRREIPQRFEHRKRYMEDYLLWLEIASSGQKIFKLPQVLAYTFKAPFGASGQSAHAWSMEKGELAAFATLRRNGLLGPVAFAFLSVYSALKFLRRLGMLLIGQNRGASVRRAEFLFPLAYVTLTQAMTALLVGAGLIGRGELAADIGITQAATWATFFALSSNARNLILSTRVRVALASIVTTRLALLLPLGAGALLLCLAARADAALAVALIVRRAVEWIGELELSECEVVGDMAAAKRILILQLGLLSIALGVVAFAPEHALWAIWVWALGPLVTTLRFIIVALRRGVGRLHHAIATLLPHFGSTAVSGVSLYVFRALLVLVAGKAAAGDLFVAFAIGSFLGSMYANVLGATVSLNEERGGGAHFPGVLLTALGACLGGGVVILALAWFAPGLLALTHKSLFFWWATGWSLVGGAVMLVAQRARLRLLAESHGERVFGPDVLMHVCLVMAVPVLYATGSTSGLTALYILNAVLALVFYSTARSGIAEHLGPGFRAATVTLVAFGVFFPVFLQQSSGIFNPENPLWDSGGVLRNVPIPISVLVVGVGFVMLGRFNAATAPLWATLGLLVLMMLSTVLLGGGLEGANREKMLLMLQILLPIMGLVLGSIGDPDRRYENQIGGAIITVVALIVPAQLLSSWLDGSFALTHSLRLFAVYQHWQYVPVILACGFFVGLPITWQRASHGGRTGLAVLLVLLGAYVAAAYSVLAMAAVALGACVFTAIRLARARDLAAISVSALAILSVIGYSVMARNTDGFMEKFGDLPSMYYPDRLVRVLWHNDGVLRNFDGWRISSNFGPGTYLMNVAPPSPRQATVLHIEGNLSKGGLGITQRNRDPGDPDVPVLIDRIGPYRVELATHRDAGIILLYQYRASAHAELTMSWRDPTIDGTRNANETQGVSAPAGVPGGGAELQGKVASRQPIARGNGVAPAEGESTPRYSPSAPATSQSPPKADLSSPMRNLSDRFADWRLFGAGILESPQAFLLGHTKPIPRAIRSSAHNFYLDFAYSFGLLALLPLLALIAYTGMLLWRHRGAVLASDSLLMLAGVVAFLVLVESNLKVTLRQPYPGIAVYFLWGLLLTRLRAAATVVHKAG